MPAIFAAHGAPILLDDAVWVERRGESYREQGASGDAVDSAPPDEKREDHGRAKDD